MREFLFKRIPKLGAHSRTAHNGGAPPLPGFRIGSLVMNFLLSLGYRFCSCQNVRLKSFFRKVLLLMSTNQCTYGTKRTDSSEGNRSLHIMNFNRSLRLVQLKRTNFRSWGKEIVPFSADKKLQQKNSMNNTHQRNF